MPKLKKNQIKNSLIIMTLQNVKNTLLTLFCDIAAILY